MGLWSSYGVGRYQASEGDMLLAPRMWGMDASRRLCIFAWGRSNTAAIANQEAYWTGISTVPPAAGIPTATGDFGSATHWGNSTAVTRLGTLRTYANTNLSPKTDKIVLLGVSMGAVLACNWARANLSSVAAIALVTPILDLTVAHSDGTFGPEIDTAYGGSSAYSAALPTSNPTAYAATLAGVPIKVWYSANDTVAPHSQMTSFVASTGAAETSMGSVGHGASATAGTEVAAFLGQFI